MTTTQIRTAAFYVIRMNITYKMNVLQGDRSSVELLKEQESRLPKVIEWIKSNDQMQEFKVWFGAQDFGFGLGSNIATQIYNQIAN